MLTWNTKGIWSTNETQKQKQKLQILTLSGYILYFQIALYFHISIRVLWTLFICLIFDGLFLQEIPMVESFFWSNYRLTIQSSDYILKWRHQKHFLGNLPIGLFRSSCPQSSIFENILHQECFLENLPKAFGASKYHRL